jgi:hypothetical protein
MLNYNNLSLKCIKLKKLNKQHLLKFKDVNLENYQLSITLTDSHVIHNTLKSENHILIAKVKSLENDLNDSKNHLKKFSSEKLNHMLNNQKYYFDRIGLGFDKSVVSSPSKLMFIKPVYKEFG